jgi:hypothetical protein
MPEAYFQENIKKFHTSIFTKNGNGKIANNTSCYASLFPKNKDFGKKDLASGKNRKACLSGNSVSSKAKTAYRALREESVPVQKPHCIKFRQRGFSHVLKNRMNLKW